MKEGRPLAGLLLHSHTELSPELAALVRLLDPACSTAEARGQLQVAGVLEAARAHGVAMTLNQRWAGLIGSETEPQTASAWAATCRATAVRTLRQRVQAETLLRALGDAGIETLLLRGLWLAEAVYADPSLRPSQDVDLWMAPEHLPAAAEVLRSAGLAPVEGEASEANREVVTGPPQARAAAGAWGSAAVPPGDWRLWVDIHVTLHVSSHGWWPFWPPYTWLRERSRPWEAMGPQVRQPTMALALLVQCDNLVRHALARQAYHDRLLGYQDAALIVENLPEADWPTVLEDARAMRVSLHLAAVLTSLERLWNVKVPDGVVAQLRRSVLSWPLAAWALRRPRGLGHLARGALFQTCAMSSHVEAARYVGRNIVPGIRHMLEPGRTARDQRTERAHP
jgi:hypothetical protein